MTTTEIGFSHYDASGAQEILDRVVACVYEVSHVDVIANPFYSVDRFVQRVQGYIRAPGFGLVVARFQDHPIGQAFGYPLPATTRWWEGLTTSVPEGFTHETGTRTFAFNELMVAPDWQRRGVAHSLHDELLGSRSEERATLLVREDNSAARAAYVRWGWRKIGKLVPYPDAPHFDAMVIPLPLTATGANS